MASIKPSAHLADVRYEIRGALTRRSRELEAAGLDVVSADRLSRERKAPHFEVISLLARKP